MPWNYGEQVGPCLDFSNAAGCWLRRQLEIPRHRTDRAFTSRESGTLAVLRRSEVSQQSVVQGQSRPSDPASVPIDVRCCSNSDQECCSAANDALSIALTRISTTSHLRNAYGRDGRAADVGEGAERPVRCNVRLYGRTPVGRACRLSRASNRGAGANGRARRASSAARAACRCLLAVQASLVAAKGVASGEMMRARLVTRGIRKEGIFPVHS